MTGRTRTQWVMLAGLAAFFVVILTVLTITTARAATTDHGWYPKRLNTTVACVRTDFPVTGSGWKVHAAIRAWNHAQDTVRFTTTPEPGCAVVTIRRYNSVGAAAFTDYPSMTVPDTGPQTYAAVDIWLNDYYPGTRATRVLSRVVLEHELGHALGLPHSDSPRSVMSYSYDPGYNLGRWRGVLQPVDTDAVAALYATG